MDRRRLGTTGQPWTPTTRPWPFWAARRPTEQHLVHHGQPVPGLGPPLPPHQGRAGKDGDGPDEPEPPQLRPHRCDQLQTPDVLGEGWHDTPQAGQLVPPQLPVSPLDIRGQAQETEATVRASLCQDYKLVHVVNEDAVKIRRKVMKSQVGKTMFSKKFMDQH